MLKRFAVIIILTLLVPRCLAAAEAVTIDESFSQSVIGKHIEFLEDPEGKLTVNGAAASESWKASERESLNFGFTASAYWFRFTIDNATDENLNLFFELTYPLMNFVDLYVPVGDGFRVIKTGSKYPFHHRDIEDKNFVFQLKEGPGLKTYYLRIKTESSLNFIPLIKSQKAYFKGVQTQLPIIWIYYGLMMIMVVYNFFIFIASRDRSYIFYVIFITSYILFQMTLNGYSFQYLWPNAIWWACHALPFFMCSSVCMAGIFIRDVIDARRLFRRLDKIFLFIIIPVSSAWAVASLFVKYAVAIKGATALVGILSSLMFIVVAAALFSGSRAARFIAVGFLGLVAGILAYVLKTFGLLPEMFITEWGVQIGSTLVVIFLSLALADKINVMRHELKILLTEQQENEKTARDRAEYLEGIVGTATGISDEFVTVSNKLQEVTNRFSELSMEQAATSEEMSSTFEELSASIDAIYESTINQKNEGEKSMHLVDELSEAQQGLIRESQKVEENIRSILESAKDTGESLHMMTETMNLINTGGKEISQFIAMIDDISDRINLLSLNAAIEAARAGDYGRGFAVVADEIGKLAQATSDNSKEIAKKISKIITDIDAGTSFVTGTRESTDGIFRMVNSIGKGVVSVRELMTKQNQALEMVMKQSGIIEKMSKEIVNSTNEQKGSMAHTQKTIDRLSEMAMEIAHSNSTIIDMTKTIHEMTLKLDGVIRGKTESA
ncbi:MAG: hypothetical protein JW807_14580 [Spirochaetes bacterium]|nr:hypothetical protein [Spirochaetota bacterium]